jgi:Triose-phosphate Transporter family
MQDLSEFGCQDKAWTFFIIVTYFLTNILLTMQNKWILSVMKFNFPWLLTGVHISVSGLGSWIFYKLFYEEKEIPRAATFTLREYSSDDDDNEQPRYSGVSLGSIYDQEKDNREREVSPNSRSSSWGAWFSKSNLLRHGELMKHRMSKLHSRILPKDSAWSFKNMVNMFLFSALYTINIAVSTMSMKYVSLAFHQINRSTIPLFTVTIEWILGLGGYRSFALYASLIPVSLGVALATLSESMTFNESTLSLFGFCLTSLGSALAALKGVASGALLRGIAKMHPFQLLYRMAPFCTLQCLLFAHFFGELVGVKAYLAPYYEQLRANSVNGQLLSSSTLFSSLQQALKDLYASSVPKIFRIDSCLQNPGYIAEASNALPSIVMSSFGETSGDFCDKAEADILKSLVLIRDTHHMMTPTSESVTKGCNATILEPVLPNRKQPSRDTSRTSSTASTSSTLSGTENGHPSDSSGETPATLNSSTATFMPSSLTQIFGVLLSSGLVAFILNWASFSSVKQTSALTMTVVNNVKQAISVFLAMLFFSSPVRQPSNADNSEEVGSPAPPFWVPILNHFGIWMTIIGGFCYR